MLQKGIQQWLAAENEKLDDVPQQQPVQNKTYGRLG